VTARRTPRPLDESALGELALAYVGRFATTRAKLRAYLTRKIRERGWNGASAPDPAAIAERFAATGYIDDSGYALMKARSLTGRGYGKRRVAEALRIAGIVDEDASAARDHAEEEAVAAALRFAERRRIGPFAASAPDERGREKAIAAMIRAGHGFAVSRAIVGLAPGAPVDPDALPH
jgi:regulatory protein